MTFDDLEGYSDSVIFYTCTMFFYEKFAYVLSVDHDLELQGHSNTIA